MSSTAANRERNQGAGAGGGVRHHQFPVGRRRYVPVVDAAGCACRPRRPSLLRIPSFLKSAGSCQQLGGKAVVKRSGGEQYSSSSTSTASLSSYAATHSTFSPSSDYYYHAAAPPAATKQHNTPGAAAARKKKNKEEVVVSKKRAATARKNKKKMAAAAAEEEEEAEGGGVGVAVEKESSDPRADFRDSMVQMVVETGLCDWDGLRCMLRRLLALNAPRHHAAILAAFAEVCAQIVAAPAAAVASSPLRSPKPGYQLYRRS